MTIEEYQVKAGTYGQYANNIYPALGLAEEAGEAVGKIAKFVRRHGSICGGTVEERERLRVDVAKELGDVMWNVAEICNVLGISLGVVMVDNIRKLDDRKARNVIQGEGDER